MEAKPSSIVVRALRNITIEPYGVLYLTGSLMYGAVYMQMFGERICRQELNYTAEVCNNLRSFPKEEAMVQGRWAIWNYYTMLAGFLPGISVLLITPWSDTYGRRLPMYGPPIGGVLSVIMLLVNVYVPTLPIWNLLLANVVNSLFGGFLGFFALTTSYICDVSDPGEDRTVRLAVLEMTMYFGGAMGRTLGAFLVQFGYDAVFYATLVCLLLSLIHLSLFVRETRVIGPVSKSTLDKEVATEPSDQQRQNVSVKARLLALVSPQSLTRIWHTLVELRPFHGRRRLFLWITGVILGQIFTDTYTIMQPFVEGAPLHWSLQWFMYLESINFYIITILYLTLFPLLRKRFQVSDTTFSILGSIQFVITGILFYVATSSWYIYAAYFIGDMFRPGLFIVTRSLMSGTVSEDEQGSLAAIMVITEKLTPLVGNAMYTLIFKWSAKRLMPSLSFGVAGVLSLIPLAFFVWARIDLRRANSERRAKGETPAMS